ncbi:MalY/PatB family protein [Clostridium sp.]|uniref:MalY/PatB family protein n=1 Tax=Clostridium sp. TaxID=1506 RepID=UPI002FCBD42E
MKYNFDKKTDRRNSNSTKWSDMEGSFISNDLLPFWIADMDFEICPDISEAMKSVLNQNIFGYASRGDSYFESACNWTKKRYGYEMDSSTLIHTPGVVLSLVLAVELLTKESDNIIISTPAYPPFYDCVLDNNRNLFLNELIIENNKYVMDFENFEKQIIDNNIKWYILCNPHNPTGRVWEKEELMKIADICLKHNVRVISDEVWRDLVYKNYNFIPFSSLSKEIEEITITCFSASKTFNLAGLQASFISIPKEEEREKLQKELGKLHLGRNNSFSVAAVEAAFNEGEEWLSELLDYLEGNLNYLSEFIKDNLQQVKFIRPEGTYVVWLDFTQVGVENINLYLQENAKVALNKGEDFDKNAKNFARINIACPRHQLEEGLNRIKNALDKL